MYKPLVLPTRSILDMLLCSLCVYVMTKTTFPPNNPPPTFPFIFGKSNEDNTNE